MKPILFNTDMVRAILEGRKTVTRRVVKFKGGRNPNWSGYIPDGLVLYGSNNIPAAKSPYRPGAILYVRETFRIDYLSNIIGTGRVHYKADGSFADIRFAPNRYDMMRRAQLKPGWRPNENMPREAARIFLRVTDVRVERLQDMTEDDVVDEGAEPLIQCPSEHRVWNNGGELIGMCWNEDVCSGGCNSIEKSYGELFGKVVWDSTIKPSDRDRYGWAANPFVWVIEFERCEKPKEVHRCWNLQ